jgi:hypothetical protein
MAKYFQRLGSQKVNFMISVKIISIQAEVKEPTALSLIWKRGPSKEESRIVDLDPSVGQGNINQTFSRIS